MAQIIKHRRGSLEALSAVTSSLQKGELVIASGSSNLSVTNGASIVFAVPENGRVQAVNRILVGANAPNTFASATYNGMLDGVPYFASGSSTLYLLGEGANTIPNLVGNISAYSASVSASLSALSASIGSGNIGSSVTALNTFSASTLTRLTALEVETANLEAFSSSALTRLTALEVETANLESTTASLNISVTNLNTFSASENSKAATLATYTGSVETRLTQVGVVTGSLILSASAAKTTNDAQDVSITNLNTFSASENSKAATLATYTGSVESRFTTIGSVTASYDGRFTSLATTTGSLITSASNAAVAITNLNAATSSYAKLSGGNVFTGQQVISGSVYITSDLVVQGSSSIQNITSSNLTLGAAFVTLNTATPISRFAGLQIIDSGSSGGSGSLLYDALQDEFIFVHRGNGTNVTSSHFLMGPETFDSLGNETYLTNNRLPKGTGKEHLNDSQITDDGTNVSIPGNLIVTGSITAPQLTAIAAITGALILSASADRVSISNINTLTSSALVRFTNLETTSASVNTSIAALNSYTSSNTSTTALNAFTASAETRFTTLANVTASLNASTASQQVSIDALNSFSASENSKAATLATYTASVDGRFTTLGTYTGSVNTRFTEVGVVTGSLITSASAAKTTNDSQGVSITNLNSTTASLLIETANLETFSSSALTRLTALEVETANLETFSGSVLTRLTEIGVVSGSLIASASAAKTTNDSQAVSITNINTFTASFGTTFSTSVDSRLDTLEGTGTIQGVGTGNNVTFAKVTTTGDVVVGGDLVVQGNTVTLNTATLIVEDKLITLASGSTNSTTADGSGFEVAGANVNFVYQHSTTSFTSSVALIAPAVTASVNLGSAAGSSKRVAFRNTNGNLDLVPTASVSGDLLQWDGTNFVMSNIVDGGSF
jgi:uncharacterized coiled-coil protein SlyX